MDISQIGYHLRFCLGDIRDGDRMRVITMWSGMRDGELAGLVSTH